MTFQIPCSFPQCDKVYVADLLSVSPKIRGLGLGAELTHMAIEAARDQGCQFFFTVATSIYSQKIYAEHFGCEPMKRLVYKEYKNKYGNPVVQDPGEHTHVETMKKRLIQDY